MNQVTVQVTTKGKTEPIVIEDPPPLLMLVHGPGLRVDLPGFVEINGRTTLDTVNNLTQDQWAFISTGPLFKELWDDLWKQALGSPDDCSLPQSVDDLRACDFGMQHVAGLIIQTCEAAFSGHNVFIREIETHLHPRVQRVIMNTVHKIMDLAGAGGKAVTTDEKPADQE